MKPVKYFSKVDIINFLFWSVLLIFFMISYKNNIYLAKLTAFFGGTLLLLIVAIYLRNKKQNVLNRVIMLSYPVIFLVFIFESLHMLMPYIMNKPYDKILADIDYYIFGFHPTVEIERITTPSLTELMFVLYAFYFIMPFFILGFLFFRKKYKELDKAIFFFLLTYYGSYLMYFAIPALGPRFYEPIVSMQKIPLEGIWISDTIRNVINILEHNKYDAFPSLHAAITLTTLIIITQYRKKWLYFFLPISIGIFISLVYCRYHYVIDIFAGIGWTLICWGLTEYCYKIKRESYFVAFYH